MTDVSFYHLQRQSLDRALPKLLERVLASSLKALVRSDNPELLAAAIGDRTRAIIPVHLYGQLAEMGPIIELATRRGITVIEDACQAHGATLGGKRSGSLAAAAAFSFYPAKNLGASGDRGNVFHVHRMKDK